MAKNKSVKSISPEVQEPQEVQGEYQPSSAAHTGTSGLLGGIEDELMAMLKELDKAAIKHHNKGVLDLTLASALNGIKHLNSQLAFIAKAYSEKMK